MSHGITSLIPPVFLLILVLICGTATATPQGEPVIAPEIGRLISEQGIDAARERFRELAEFPSLDFNLSKAHPAQWSTSVLYRMGGAIAWNVPCVKCCHPES